MSLNVGCEAAMNWIQRFVMLVFVSDDEALLQTAEQLGERAVLQRNAKHEARLSNISGSFLASCWNGSSEILRCAQNDRISL